MHGGAPGAPCPARALLSELTAVLGDGTEARWIVAAATGLGPAELTARLDEPLSASAADAARHMAERRVAGEPLQYVLGSWGFRGLEVAVDGRVLVPRHETEQVVTFALEELARVAAEQHPSPAVAVDLGTGSGVIALSLATEGPADLEVWASDLSPGALEVARHNLDQLAATHPDARRRVHLVAGSWFGALPPRLAGAVQVIVSNPPYVSAAEWEQLDPVVRDHEPYDALVPGQRGLEAIERIVDEAPHWLVAGGALVVELAPHQADAVAALARARGFAEVATRPDLAGRARALVARWQP